MTVFYRYVTVDLVSFIDHYNSFVGLLQGNEKKLVIAMNPFIDDIIKNKDELKRMRNKWIAHVVNHGDFAEELSKPIKQIPMMDMIIMINGLNLFVMGLEEIFPRQADYLNENFRKNIEDVVKDHAVTNETIQIFINDKIQRVNAMFELHRFSYQFTPEKYNIGGERL